MVKGKIDKYFLKKVTSNLGILIKSHDGQDKFAEKISSLVMVAPALNFIRPHYQHYYNNMEEEDRDKLDQGEVLLGNFQTFI